MTADGTPVYLATIGCLAAALREIKDCYDTGTAGHDIACKALADADEPQRIAATLAAVTAARDEYRDNVILHVRERDEARAAVSELLGMFKAVSGGWAARTSSSRLLRIAATVGVHWDGLAAPVPDSDAAAGIRRYREGITELIADLEASAAATAPSRKSQIEHEIAIGLRKLLEA